MGVIIKLNIIFYDCVSRTNKTPECLGPLLEKLAKKNLCRLQIYKYDKLEIIDNRWQHNETKLLSAWIYDTKSCFHTWFARICAFCLCCVAFVSCATMKLYTLSMIWWRLLLVSPHAFPYSNGLRTPIIIIETLFIALPFSRNSQSVRRYRLNNNFHSRVKFINNL